eukprot:542506_1
MERTKLEYLVLKLNDSGKNSTFQSSKMSLLMSLRSCIENNESVGNDNECILNVFPKVTEIMKSEDVDLFTVQQAAFLVTDIGNDYNLGLTFKLPIEAIKQLAILLENYEDMTMALVEGIIMLLASLCNCGESDTKKEIILNYRNTILYETESVKYVFEIIKQLIDNIVTKENFTDIRYARYDKLLLSVLRSCVYTMLCFIPRGIILVKESNWYIQYGEYILNALCECVLITDRAILGDVSDGLATIYILSSDNHKAGAVCAKMLKLLYNNGKYYMVKKAAKHAVMPIVVEFYIRQSGCSQRCPTDIVFKLVTYVCLDTSKWNKLLI